jgi:hypothetical protein
LVTESLWRLPLGRWLVARKASPKKSSSIELDRT